MDENEKKEVIDITPEENKKETTTENVAKEEKSNGTNKDKKGLAIAAMVLGIVSLVLFWIKVQTGGRTRGLSGKKGAALFPETCGAFPENMQRFFRKVAGLFGKKD